MTRRRSTSRSTITACNDFKPYVFVSNDYGKTFRSISAGLPTDRPGSSYVIAEDPVNPNLLYVGTEIGVFASLNKGANWFPLRSGLPTVPVYDLKIHPRDRELIAGTHGRGILDPGRRAAAADERRRPRASRRTCSSRRSHCSTARCRRRRKCARIAAGRSDGGPSGAVISYRLAGNADSARISIVSTAGDTIARLTGPARAGLNRVEWNLPQIPTGQVNLSGRGGRGGGAATNVPGFPPGFIPRPAESAAAPDSSGSPTAQARALAAAGGAGRGGRWRGRGWWWWRRTRSWSERRGFRTTAPAMTADYRVVLDVAGQQMTQTLRVVVVPPGVVSCDRPQATGHRSQGLRFP